MHPQFHCVLWARGILLALISISVGCENPSGPASASPKDLESAVAASLDTLVAVWYPLTVDTVNGGFWSDFNYRWERSGAQHKMLVSQARHIWTAATLADFYDDPDYLHLAAHGYRFLRDHMWDSIHGGFHTLLGIKGDSLQVLSHSKSAYGNSFAIYGLATYYRESKDTMALELAKRTFQWLEENAHDPDHLGYFDVMKRDGSWLLDVSENEEGFENFIRKDWKDQNSSIHLLESFTALYEVWPDPLVRERLEELLFLIRDTIVTDQGYLTLHLERDWAPVSLRDSSETYRRDNFWLDHVSFGHDVETAFLMLEASHILERENDTVTLKRAKQMVDHALDWGFDREKGGFFDGGYYGRDVAERSIENEAKVWWTQAEGLNSLLLFSKLFPGDQRYDPYFQKQWDYLDAYMIDHRYGGWFHEGLDTDPGAAKDAKAHIWKVNYHNIRSLVNVLRMMRGDFALTTTKQAGH